jgi:hypothetical protein
MQKIMVSILIILVIASILIVSGKFSSVMAADDAGVLAKLEEVVKGQKEILQDLGAIKSELAIIKVRITQQQ